MSAKLRTDNLVLQREAREMFVSLLSDPQALSPRAVMRRTLIHMRAERAYGKTQFAMVETYLAGLLAGLALGGACDLSCSYWTRRNLVDERGEAWAR